MMNKILNVFVIPVACMYVHTTKQQKNPINSVYLFNIMQFITFFIFNHKIFRDCTALEVVAGDVNIANALFFTPKSPA